MEDTFKVNFSYHNNSLKVRVPVMHSKAAKSQEINDIEERVDHDRRHMIEATIVKVMKSRKRLSHQDLILEATKILQSKFMPDPQVIKKRIEHLIEREFLARDKDDRRFFNYLA